MSYSPAVTEVFNPMSNPFEVPLRGFVFGKRLRVVLRPTDKKDKKFHINLKSGQDIVVHFNPRLKDKALVFNSYFNGSWQHEERASVVFPFEVKEIYTVHVNGQFLYEFRERQSGWTVSSVEIGGEVNVHSVHVA
ncbi:unnamed protein product [Nippostrongylus brasiliensis]|uniref:Galectin n=1 Tax=Nippostrongylus brasiliensis TaxID=27835 RepID=A0A0N4XCF3_NIPBR|nr:unnamed protein product [Nippostrongylus brasiliensis]